ncbi:hypothetical protein niasHT_008822 [Heterodera trifolii]|uniref:Non-specific serine/threonine protein kinase n=1 Tax=Heterodera trifolii TaxID=157864 RepID=A0ABD2LUL0_9BILA
MPKTYTTNIFSHSSLAIRPFLGQFGQLLRGGTAAGRAHSSRHLHGRPGRVSSSVPVPRTVVELPKSFLEKHHLAIAFKVLKAILVILWPGSAKNSDKLFGKWFTAGPFIWPSVPTRSSQLSCTGSGMSALWGCTGDRRAFICSICCLQPLPMASTSTVKEKRERWKQDYKCRKMGRLHCEYEDDILDRWHAEMEKQRSRSASYLIARREKAKLLPAAPAVKKVPCPSCKQSFDSKKSLSNHKRACSAPARVTHPPDRMTRRRVLNFDKSDAEDPAEEVPPVAVDPKEREERWVDPLPAKLQFQQQVNKIAELKCKYSRANAKVRWYKDRKELFSDGPKYEILIDKQSITLIINNPDPDDSGKYTCKANEMPTNSCVTVEGPSIKYVFLTPLPNTLDIYRTKQGVLACKLNSARAPLVWQRDGKPIDVDDQRYQIEKDAAGCFTLTIRVVERIDQGMWTATVNKDVISKCQVSVVEEPRDFVEMLKSQSANENENVTFECVVNDEDIDVEWFHGDAKIKMDGRHFKEERVGCHRRLLITNLRIEDQGQYKCTTKNDKSMAQLIVDPLKKFECEAGKQKQIKVPFEVKGTRRGDPKPILLRNGKPVDLSKMKDLVEVIINGTVANIVFKNPQKSEAGKWSLKLENTGGVSTEAAFELVVKEKPKTPKGQVDTLDVTSASCEFLRGANEKSQQLFDEIAAEMALRRANDEQETESSDTDEDEYVVESDDDIPAVEANAIVERNPAPTFVSKKGGQKVPLTGLVRCQTDVDTGKDNAHAAPTATCSSATTSAAGIFIASAAERRSDANSFRVKTAATSSSTASAARTAIVSAVSDKVPAWLNHDDMLNLVVRAGQTAEWKVKFGGKPAPKVAWSKNQQPINPKTSEPIQVHTKTNDHTTLRIPATTRADCGAFTLLVRNSKGMDTKTAHLTVLGKPSKPRVPLEVNDVTEYGCVLRWTAPEDDGGLPIDHYEVEKLEGGKWVPCAKVSDCVAQVKELKKGQQYQFRVKAVNKEGKSEELCTEHEIVTKNQYADPGKNPNGTDSVTVTIAVKSRHRPTTPKSPRPLAPGKMEKPSVTGWDKDHVHLEWQPPANDAAAQLEEYVVKKKDATTGKWVEAIRVSADQTKATVPGLREGEQYQFCVAAKNKEGVGQFSDPTGPVVAMPRNLPPRIHREDLSDLVIQPGEDVRFNVHIDGEPAPTVTWTYEDDKALPRCANVHDQDYLSKFSMIKPTLAQSGKYTVTATNPNGTDLVSVTIAVKSRHRPTTPKSPRPLAPGKKLKPKPVDDDELSPTREFYELLELCDQRNAVSWSDFELSAGSFADWSKIGEGAFGEVFKYSSIAFKIMPFAINAKQCLKSVNNDKLKPANFIFNELSITQELTKLSEATGASFTNLITCKVVKGCFPQQLLDAWDVFKKEAAKSDDAQNERPDIYADEELHFIVIGLSYGGKNLEAYEKENGGECYSIFHQIALSLAIAEDVLEFEHRDLHAGNILVEKCPANEKIRYLYRGEQIDVVSNGVRASIIDFSISRLRKKDVRFFVDLSQETELFEQDGVSDGGDYQCDVYRMMKAAVNEKWAEFWPQTNVLWMGYAAKNDQQEEDHENRPLIHHHQKNGSNGRSARCSQPDMTKPTCAGGQQRQQKQYDTRKRRGIRSNGIWFWLSCARSAAICPSSFLCRISCAENVCTLFVFVLRCFDAIGHQDAVTILKDSERHGPVSAAALAPNF